MCSSIGSSDRSARRSHGWRGGGRYLAGRAKIADLAAREVVFGYDGETALWWFKLQARESGFVKSFQIGNYQPTRAHLPPPR